MLRIIGAVMICGGCTMIGVSAANRLAVRLRVMNAWVSAIDFMRAEIEFLLTPITELLDKCIQSANPHIKRFFEDCRRRLDEDADMSFSQAWQSALEDAEYLELNSVGLQILEDLGNTLGKYQTSEQIGRLENLSRAMLGRAQAAEQEKTKLGKLYGSLGVACGIALIIVFI